MWNSRRWFQQLNWAILLFCCSVPANGKPLHGVATIQKRSVSEHQFMHDRSRAMQELQRRLWLHNVMGELHTAEGGRTARQRAAGRDSPELAVLLLGLEASSSPQQGSGTLLEQDQDTSNPAASKQHSARRNGRRRKAGRSSRRRAHRAREERSSRRDTRSAVSEVRDPGSRADPLPIPTAHRGRLWHRGANQ
ncbi:parathyroid hormone-related protein-like isoform X2 [Scyliorhinus canicula]|nr:parathyroid hormone-related protein-like isoform X2 [Scyliorhinus canicula]